MLPRLARALQAFQHERMQFSSKKLAVFKAPYTHSQVSRALLLFDIPEKLQLCIIHHIYSCEYKTQIASSLEQRSYRSQETY